MVLTGHQAKRARLCDDVGPLAAVNPIGGGGGDVSLSFSPAAFSRMMADTRRAWEQLDADKARSRKEQISTTRNEVAAGGSVIQAFSSSTCTEWAGSPHAAASRPSSSGPRWATDTRTSESDPAYVSARSSLVLDGHAAADRVEEPFDGGAVTGCARKSANTAERSVN